MSWTLPFHTYSLYGHFVRWLYWLELTTLLPLHLLRYYATTRPFDTVGKLEIPIWTYTILDTDTTYPLEYRYLTSILRFANLPRFTLSYCRKMFIGGLSWDTTDGRYDLLRAMLKLTEKTTNKTYSYTRGVCHF